MDSLNSSPDEEHAQMQYDECISLSAMYPEEFKLLSGIKCAGGGGNSISSSDDADEINVTIDQIDVDQLRHPISFTVALVSDYDQCDIDTDSRWSTDPSFALHVTYPQNYPHPGTPPFLQLRGGSNILHPVLEEALLNTIYTAAESELRIGVPCIMTCIATARTFFENGCVVSGLLRLLSEDSLCHILGYLATSSEYIDEVVDALPILSIVSKKNGVWKRICRQRWTDMWGFEDRWRKALDEEKMLQNDQFWHSRYLSEERDGQRELIRLEELKRMCFDVRKWFGNPAGQPDHMRNVVPTGLKVSVAFARFGELPTDCTHAYEVKHSNCSIGHVQYKPSKSVNQCWELVKIGNVSRIDVRLIFPAPDAPSKARLGKCASFVVHRLSNWGWELRSQQMVMRAVDTLPFEEGFPADHAPLILSELWKDYLGTLVFEERPPWAEERRQSPYPCTSREVPSDEDLKCFLEW